MVWRAEREAESAKLPDAGISLKQARKMSGRKRLAY